MSFLRNIFTKHLKNIFSSLNQIIPAIQQTETETEIIHSRKNIIIFLLAEVIVISRIFLMCR